MTQTRHSMIKGCESCERLQDEVNTLKEEAARFREEVFNLTLAKKTYQTANESLVEKLAKQADPPPLDLSKPFRHQRQERQDASKCPLCQVFLYKAAIEPGRIVRQSDKDERFCSGRSWWAFWSNCPKTAHLHRHCYWCNARWMEAP